MIYLKIENGKLIEAQEIVKRNGKIVYGYNQNKQMMIEDGFKKFEKSFSDYEIKNGKIVEKQIISNPEIEKETFTKLQIRRAMRKLNIEDQLDNILENNSDFKKEWDDAIEIDLNDPMIQNIINQGFISEENIQRIKVATKE